MGRFRPGLRPGCATRSLAGGGTNPAATVGAGRAGRRSRELVLAARRAGMGGVAAVDGGARAPRLRVRARGTGGPIERNLRAGGGDRMRTGVVEGRACG